MKKALLFLFFIFPALTVAFAQEEEEVVDAMPEVKIQNDQIVFNVITNMLNPVPDNVTAKPFSSLGAEIYSYSPLIGKKKKVGVAMGIGVGTLNYDIGTIPGLDSLKKTVFNKIPDSINYKKSKITVAYWDIPIEVRFRTNPSTKGNAFKLALGFKFGIMLSNHWKYKGDSFDEDEKTVKFKIYNVDNVMKIRYGAYARLGYGKFTLMGTYYLTPLFIEDKGPESMVLSMGLSFLII